MNNVNSLYEHWVNKTICDESIHQELLSMNDKNKEDAFYKDIKFGTGGIRGIMGAGSNRLNIYTVRKVAEGYAHYISKFGAQQKGICIAYDNRRNSNLFAQECASVLASHDIKVYLFDDLRPTPELSFAIRELNAFGGIVITASHNPKEYNGLKIYNVNGCQCVPRESDEIISYINNIKDLFSIEVEESKSINICNIGKEIDEKYYALLHQVEENPKLNKENFKIVYTPLHGTGYIPCKTMLQRIGYDVCCVEEQCIPDSEFSATESINPENKKSFTSAIALAEKEFADLVVATDPDCDRLGVVVRHNEKYEYLTGNQTGAILLYYILEQKTRKGTLPKNSIVFNTIVTSDLGTKICEKYGVEVESTLTGFKFIGDKIEEYKNKKNFLFGYEESYGYLIKDFVRDKDGVQSTILIAEVCNYFKKKGKTLIDVLNDIFDEFGHIIDIQENQTLFGKDGLEEIEAIVNKYRNEPIDTLENRKVIIKEDYKLSKRYYKNKVEDINLPKSNVIKFFLEDGSWVVVRPSGNEPKIKFYKNLLIE